MENIAPIQKQEGYSDIYFRLIVALLAAHTIVVYGEDISIFKLLLLWDYWRSLLLSFVIAFLLVTIVYWITITLDKDYDWKSKTVQRIGLQLLMALILPGLLAYFLAFFYFRAYGIDIAVTRYLKYDFPVIILMLILLNVYYIAFYFYKRWQFTEKQVLNNGNGKQATALSDIPSPKDVFVVQTGTKIIPLPASTIAYFFHEGDFNLVRTFQKEDFIVSTSLDEIQQQLNDRQFFRANRQVIVNFTACQHIELLEYGKLQLFVSPSIKETIIISQKRAKAFKDWMERK